MKLRSDVKHRSGRERYGILKYFYSSNLDAVVSGSEFGEFSEHINTDATKCRDMGCTVLDAWLRLLNGSHK